MRARPGLLVWLVLAGPLAGAQESGTADENGSLEGYLERLRARREASHRRLRASVADVVDRLERQAGLPEKARDPSLVLERLVALGPEAAPLFVPYLDPGSAPPEAASYRAATLVTGLAALPTDATLDGLFEMARHGTPQGRLNAVRLLGHASARRRVAVALLELLEGSEGRLEAEVAAALARLPGEHNGGVLADRLLDAQEPVVRGILEAWAERRARGARTAVLELSRRPQSAAPVLGPLVRYWAAVPDVLGADGLDALVALAADHSVDVQGRVRVLEALIDLRVDLDGDQRDRLEPMAESLNTTLREAALVCLALAGDRQARRQLLRGADEEVDRNRGYPPAWEKRGDLLMRLKDYDDAARDYREAIDLLARDRRGAGTAIHVKLARCYALDGRLRNAYETLDDARLGPEELAELAEDPDFAELREHSRYGRVFE